MSCKMRDLSHIKRVCRNFPSCLHLDQTCLFCKLSFEKHCGLWDKRTDRDNLTHTHTHTHTHTDTHILSNSLDNSGIFFLKYYFVVHVDSCTNLTCLFFLMEHFSGLYFQISLTCVYTCLCVWESTQHLKPLKLHCFILTQISCQFFFVCLFLTMPWSEVCK